MDSRHLSRLDTSELMCDCVYNSPRSQQTQSRRSQKSMIDRVSRVESGHENQYIEKSSPSGVCAKRRKKKTSVSHSKYDLKKLVDRPPFEYVSTLPSPAQPSPGPAFSTNTLVGSQNVREGESE